MKSIGLLITGVIVGMCCSVPTMVNGQDVGDYMIALHSDLVKTDNSALVDKAQFGAELNYFVLANFSATSGLEFWTNDEVSFLLGARWFANDDAFLRARVLVGENDFSIGGGWVRPLGERFRFEAIADFYFKIDFAIRAGFVYRIPRQSRHEP